MKHLWITTWTMLTIGLSPIATADEAEQDAAAAKAPPPVLTEDLAASRMALDRAHFANYPSQFRLPSADERERPGTASGFGQIHRLPHHANQGYREPAMDPAALTPQDDFIEKALAEKRLELLNLVDDDDQQVFLGLTREGFLGFQVQMRDSKR